MDDNGKLQIEPLIDMIPDEEKKKKVHEEVDECLKEAESKTGKGSNNLENN